MRYFQPLCNNSYWGKVPLSSGWHPSACTLHNWRCKIQTIRFWQGLILLHLELGSQSTHTDLDIIMSPHLPGLWYLEMLKSSLFSYCIPQMNFPYPLVIPASSMQCNAHYTLIQSPSPPIDTDWMLHFVRLDSVQLLQAFKVQASCCSSLMHVHTSHFSAVLQPKFTHFVSLHFALLVTGLIHCTAHSQSASPAIETDCTRCVRLHFMLPDDSLHFRLSRFCTAVALL